MSKLNIVDVNDNVIGEEERSVIHKNGLLHREIVVWIYNGKEEILLQKRVKNKDTFPNKWTFSIEGHVEAGELYINGALFELSEELGLYLQQQDLIIINKIQVNIFDSETKTQNNSFRTIYAYKFDGDINNLTIQKEELDEIKWWKIDEVLNPEEEVKKTMCPILFEKQVQDSLISIKDIK